MTNLSFWTYLLILSGSTYLIRAVPFAMIKNKLENQFVQSFLTYIPYAVLTAMTIPSVFYCTNYVEAAIVGFVIAVILAFKEKGLTFVAIFACVGVLCAEYFITLL